MIDSSSDPRHIETAEEAGGGAGLVALFYDDSVDMATVGLRLQAEPSLLAKVLKVANSPYYRSGGRVETFEDAIIVLGLSCVRGVAAVGCMDRFPVPIPGTVSQSTVATRGKVENVVNLDVYRPPALPALTGPVLRLSAI